MLNYEVIATGSTGNAVFYHNCVLVDIGVSFAKIKHVSNNIKLVLLTHEHKDHINLNTLIKLQNEHPSIRVGCGEWMVKHIQGVENVDIFEVGNVYCYGTLEICPITLYHDVKNIGFRIFNKGHKLFHATDTQHLEGIAARNYDAYFIEQNYDEEKIKDIISEKQLKGEFCYEIGSINGHLSIEQSFKWLNDNNKNDSLVVPLHQSSRNL